MVRITYRIGLALAVVGSPCLGAVGIVSSSRSVTATAQTQWNGLPGPTPAIPLVTGASPAHTTGGPFIHSTGLLTARAPRQIGVDFWIETTATTSASMNSLVSPQLMSGSVALLVGADGRGDQPSQANAQALYSVSFIVDEQTPFTLTGNYDFTNGEFSHQRVKLSLGGFVNIDQADAPFGDLPAQPINVAGTFLPGTTYTLNAELYLTTEDSSTARVAFGTPTLDFKLAVPEPGMGMSLVGLVVGLWRVRRPR